MPSYMHPSYYPPYRGCAPRGRGYSRGQGHPTYFKSQTRYPPQTMTTNPTAATRGRGSLKLVNKPIPASAQTQADLVAVASDLREGSAESVIAEKDLNNPEAFQDSMVFDSKIANPPPLRRPSKSTGASGVSEFSVGGYTFVKDLTGRKLIRKTTASRDPSSPLLPSSQPAPAASTSTTAVVASTKPAPASASPAYIRTKSGCLVSLTALKRHRALKAQKVAEIKKARLMSMVGQLRAKYAPSGRGRGMGGRATVRIARPPLKKDSQCRFFAKTGTCRKGLICPYNHDPACVAICPRSLTRSCPHTTASCPLSHNPSAHNMPHCAHFPCCTKGPACPYTHIKVSPTASVCRDFAEVGWCKRGEECTERHVRECREFSEKGTCSTKGCRLPHIIARGKRGVSQEDEEEDDYSHPPPSSVLGRHAADGSDGQLDGKATEVEGTDLLFPQDLMPASTNRGKRAGEQADSLSANQDFVMFNLSEEDDGDEEEEEEYDDAISVDSEELEEMKSAGMVAEKIVAGGGEAGDGIDEELEEGEVREDEGGELLSSDDDDPVGIEEQLLGIRKQL